MLTASNRLWMEKAANKRLYWQKNDIKAGEFTGNMVGLIFIEWNIIVTFLLHYSTALQNRAENKTKLCVGFRAFSSQSEHPFLHNASVLCLWAICAAIIHSSFTYLKKIKSWWIYLIRTPAETLAVVHSNPLTAPENYTFWHSWVVGVCLTVLTISWQHQQVCHSFIFHINWPSEHCLTRTTNTTQHTHVEILWFVNEAVRMLLIPPWRRMQLDATDHTCWRHAITKVMLVCFFACCLVAWDKKQSG